jgi:hypothetical protein
MIGRAVAARNRTAPMASDLSHFDGSSSAPTLEARIGIEWTGSNNAYFPGDWKHEKNDRVNKTIGNRNSCIDDPPFAHRVF